MFQAMKSKQKLTKTTVLPVLHTHTLHFFKSINDQNLSACGNSSGDSFTAVSIFKIIDHEAKEDNDEGKIVIESSISEIELLRGDWLIRNNKKLIKNFQVRL